MRRFLEMLDHYTPPAFGLLLFVFVAILGGCLYVVKRVISPTRQRALPQESQASRITAIQARL